MQRGGVLVVHTSFSRVGPLAGGPIALISALRGALGPDGTLVMPSMSDDDERPFEVAETPCRGMGVVAETFWRLPDVVRSDNPHAFAASGAHARRITASHPLDVPHGLDSPIGRVWELDGQVLLLGLGHDANDRPASHAHATSSREPSANCGEMKRCFCTRWMPATNVISLARRSRTTLPKRERSPSRGSESPPA